MRPRTASWQPLIAGIVFWLLAMISVHANGQGSGPSSANAFVDASSVNVPASFSTSAASKVLSGFKNMSALSIDNWTASNLVVNCAFSSQTEAPSNSSSLNLYVKANSVKWWDGYPLSNQCFVRGETGAITTGKFNINVWRQSK